MTVGTKTKAAEIMELLERNRNTMSTKTKGKKEIQIILDAIEIRRKRLNPKAFRKKHRK